MQADTQRGGHDARKRHFCDNANAPKKRNIIKVEDTVNNVKLQPRRKEAVQSTGHEAFSKEGSSC
jgi:hypothetical protein